MTILKEVKFLCLLQVHCIKLLGKLAVDFSKKPSRFIVFIQTLFYLVAISVDLMFSEDDASYGNLGVDGREYGYPTVAVV